METEFSEKRAPALSARCLRVHHGRFIKFSVLTKTHKTLIIYRKQKNIIEVKKLNIKEKFANIEDPRHQSYVEHKLCDVLTIVMCAVMSGLDQLSDIMMYAANRVSLLSGNYSGLDRQR
ncbi:hypothetical protein AGMMS50276_10690 [Synergistales bacterium]|nr:hypothetical protein AGMMS50276_10690 [Synergistales bacterium]